MPDGERILRALILRHPRTAFRTSEVSDDEAAALSACDWTKVDEFKGFICKVKHNDLWDTLPYTRTILAYSNLEFVAFRRYAPVFERLRSSGRSSRRDDKIVGLTDFLFNEFKEGCANLTLLQSIVLHERVIWELRNAQKAQQVVCPKLAPLNDSITGELLLAVVPVTQGAFRVVRCEVNPFDVVAALGNQSLGIGRSTFAPDGSVTGSCGTNCMFLNSMTPRQRFSPK